jgi:transposase
MNPTTLCVGADIHQDQIVLRFVDKQTEAEVQPRLTIPNNRPGADQLLTVLTRLLTEHGYTQLQLGWEATGLLWLPFYTYLAQSQALLPFSPQFLCFNPKLVADFKQGLALHPDKIDASDALGIAHRLQIGHLPSGYIAPPAWQGLRRLTRYRFQLAHTLAAEKVRFQALAFVKASDWIRGKPFCQVTGATSATLLTDFRVEELARLPLGQLTHLIHRLGRNRFDDPAQTARHVQQVLASSFPVDAELDAALTFTLATQWQHLQELRRLVRRLDREIARWMERVPNPLLSVRGLGPVITAGLLAEIADVTRFRDHPQLARYAGLTWKKWASGHFVAEETRLTKTGNAVLRYYLLEGADRMRRFDLEYQAFYWRKYGEVHKHQHKRALVLTARKLVRLVHALLTSNQPDVRPQTKASPQEEDTD